MTSSRDASVVERTVQMVQSHPDELLVVVGPTASGKTALAVETAERVGAEIIGADSVQVYRGFDIGSGKPTAGERARAPHHLVSALDPGEPMNAAIWAESARRAIDDVRERGRIPIVCGGTFLWVKALLFGLAAAPTSNPEVRARHRAIAANAGRETLHAHLHRVDPEIAARLHPNDFVRVSRALEVYELTGRPLSAIHREHARSGERRSSRLVAIENDVATLTARIEARVAEWLANGWIEEVEGLLAAGHGEARAMSSVGYAQIRSMLRDEIPRSDLESAIVRATRTFARRQRTWLKHADVTWLLGR